MSNSSAQGGFRLHIDRLVLKGISFTHYERLQFREAVHAELTERFSNAGISDIVKSIPGKLKTTPIQVASMKPDPVSLGRQIGANIFNSISGEKSSNGSMKK
jgi:hypothetical protein